MSQQESATIPATTNLILSIDSCLFLASQA